MMLLISLIIGFLLTSIIFTEQFVMMIVLAGVFAIIGLLTIRSLHAAFLALLFALPLVPSLPEQLDLSVFSYEQFFLLCFAFWWSVKRALTRNGLARPIPLVTPFLILLGYFALSSALALVRYNLLGSDLFLLKIKEHWNVFRPLNPLEDVSSLRMLLTTSEGLLFYFIAVDLLDKRERIQLAARVFVYSAACVALLGVLQQIFDFRLLIQWRYARIGFARINSTFADPNSLGVYLSAAFVLAGVFLFLERKRIMFALLAVLAAALVLTGSRSAWTAIVVVLVIVPFLIKVLRVDPALHLNRFCGIVFKYGTLLLLVAAFLVVVKVSLYNPPANPDPGTNTIKYIRWRWDRVLKGRIGIWRSGLHMFADDPIYGKGLGTFPRAMEDYTRYTYAFFYKENAHNYYLQLLAETGIIGLSLFLFVMFLILQKGVRFLRNTTTREDFLPAYGLFSAILIFLLGSLAQHPLLLLKLQILFWFLIGSFMAMTRESETEQKRHHTHLASLLLLIAMVYAPFQVHSILQTRKVPPYEHGFGDWQQSQSVPFRIMKSHATSLLPVEGRVLAIDFSALKLPSLENPPYIEIYINKQFADRVVFLKKGWQTFTCDLSRYRPNEIIRLELISGPSQATTRTAVRPFQWRYR